MAETAVATAFVTIVPTTKGFQQTLSKDLSGVSDKAGKESGGKFSSGFGGALKGLVGTLGAVFAVNAIKNFAQESVLAGEAVSTANARIEQIASQTQVFGDATGQVTDRLIALAEANEMRIATDANVIKGVQAQLLSFKALSASADEAGGAFDRANAAVFDMAAAGMGSAESNAIALGKALEDPTKGITALSRTGTVFTDQQKEQIAAMQAAGDLAGAQELILTELESQYGGVAEATADASEKMSLAFGNIKEQVGAALMPTFATLVEGMTPVIETLGPVLAGVIEELSPVLQNLAGQLPGILKGFMPMIPVIGELVGIFFELAADLLPIFVDLIAALMPLFTDLVPIIAEFIGDAMEVLVPILVQLVETLVPIVEALMPVFMELFEALTPVVMTLIEAFLPLIETLLPVFIGLIELLTPILVWVAELIGTVLVVAIDLLIGAIEWVTETFAEFATFFENVWNGIKDFFEDIINGLIGGFEGFVNGAIKGINRVIDAINRMSFTVPDWVPEIGGNSFGFNIGRLSEISLPRVALADGGYVNGPTNALIGEAGPEVVMPLDRFEKIMGLENGGGQTVNYYAAPNKSLEAEQELLLAMRRVKVMA